MKTVNIYGEPVSGTIIKERTNVAILEDEKAVRHVVHLSDIRKHKAKGTAGMPAGSFNLKECQRIGRTGRKTRRKGY